MFFEGPHIPDTKYYSQSLAHVGYRRASRAAAYLFVPYVQRFAADTVEDRQKSALKSVLKHRKRSSVGGYNMQG